MAHAVADGLRQRGIDVLTASEAGTLGLPDPEVLARAADNRRVFVTHDGDYVALHFGGQIHAGVAFSEQGSRSVGDLVLGLEELWKQMTADEMAGRPHFIARPRRTA